MMIDNIAVGINVYYHFTCEISLSFLSEGISKPVFELHKSKHILVIGSALVPQISIL